MENNTPLFEEVILNKIFEIRGRKVMLDSDLAALYQVETKHLKQAVRRNIGRFPNDFMFELTENEFEILRSHFGTSSWGGSRYLPMAFTEQGVAMLSSVLKSEVAINVNIQIIRLFSKMRSFFLDHQELLQELKELKSKVQNHDENFEIIFNYLENLNPKNTGRKQIGLKKYSF